MVKSSRKSNSQDNEQAYEPQVSHSSDGTVSCSIEETNKMRAELGLPPLKADESNEKERKNQQEKEEQDEINSKNENGKNSQVHKRLEQAQQRRKEREITRTKSLGEGSDDEDESAMNWIKKTKRRAKQRQKEEMERRMKEEEEMAEKAAQEYSSGMWELKYFIFFFIFLMFYIFFQNTENLIKIDLNSSSLNAADLSGMKVLHDKNKFEEGQEFVLNLADKNVLDENDDDELENIDMRAQDKKEWQTKQKKSAYSVFDNLEQRKQSVLPQYDDENLEQPQESFVLGQKPQGSSSQLERVRNKIRKPSSSKKKYSLEGEDTSEFKPTEDQSQDTGELLNQMKRRRKKKKKNLRKKEIESDTIENENENHNYNHNNIAQNTASSMDIEHDEDNEDDQDYASRSARQTQDDHSQRLAKMAKKEQAFQHAQQKAQEETTAMAGKHDVALADTDEIEHGDDSYFYQNLQRVHKLAQEKPKQPENVVLKAVEQASNVEQQQQQETPQYNTQENQSALVFDPTSEFCRHISLEEDNTSTLISRRRKPRKKLRKKETDSTELQSQSQSKSSNSHSQPSRQEESKSSDSQQVESMEVDTPNEQQQQEQQQQNAPSIDNEKQPKENHDETNNINGQTIKQEEYQPILEEPLVGSSLTAALSFAKQKGMMSDEYKGRAKDQRPDAEMTKASDNRKGPGIVLEYLDDQGTAMTQKEAFRYQSYRFHNIRKSKTKLEKERKKREQDLKMKKLTDPNTAVDALRTTQEITSQPFVTIQGKGTSDLSKAASSVLSESSKKRKAEIQAGGNTKRRKK